MRYTHAAVVPFKIKSKEINDIILRMSFDEHNDEISGVENGWILDWNTVEYEKNNVSLYCTLLKKNDLVLFIINESPWSNGGDNDYCIFSTEMNPIFEFCNNFKICPKVYKDNIVQQTG